jgi:hypothetical protein
VRDIDWYRRPELILSELIKKEARGEKDRSYYRAVVLAVDLEGGKLQNSDASGEVRVPQRTGENRTYKAIVGPPNPRGAVKARILTDGFDRLLDDDSLRVFWPMFPQDLAGIPATPGEHVYVVFEGEGTSNGLWISRVAGQESANSFDGKSSYDAPSSPQSAMDTFEENEAQYPQDEEYAGLAPTKDAMTSYEDG